jgi:hypothetical protein
MFVWVWVARPTANMSFRALPAAGRISEAKNPNFKALGYTHCRLLPPLALSMAFLNGPVSTESPDRPGLLAPTIVLT